ncbi:MAG: acyl carrier protein [Rickettsiales bacterium]|nr:acyl carrier protein [Rickettsiales bacterium]
MKTKEFLDNLLQEKFHLNLQGLSPEDKLAEDLDIDSLDVVEVLLELEKEFDRSIPDNAATDLETLGDLYAMAEKHCG